ncbi:hypothetical protein E2C01_094311 [Portunus trituberculatus]|uniref:Uncharacterized protein n=1 Tax=Portunus trituberculatus TaxID=210409 RepID=A0A5B7K2R9_PORTR|nr:hypothetical protein [Portunus trituberculatus]
MRRGLIVLGPESTFRATRRCSNQSLSNHCVSIWFL